MSFIHFTILRTDIPNSRTRTEGLDFYHMIFLQAFIFFSSFDQIRCQCPLYICIPFPSLCILPKLTSTQPFREMNDSIGKGLKSRVMSRVPYFGCTFIVHSTLLLKKYHKIKKLLESKLLAVTSH